MPEGEDNLTLYLVLAVGAGLLCLGLMQLIGDLRRREDKRVGERLTSFSGSSGPPAHLLRDMVDTQRSIIAKVLGSGGLGGSIRQFLMQADVPWAAHKVVGGLSLLLCVGLLFGITAKYLLKWDISPVGIAMLGAAAGGLPALGLAVKRALRLTRFGEQMPEMFEMLGQTLRAGHSLVTGIQLCGEQLPDPIGKEMARVYQEQSFGAKLEESLTHFADRMGLLDVRMFVTAVLIQRQTGGDLAEVLDKSGQVIRGRLELARQVKALTAEGRISGWVLALLPPIIGLIMYKMNPKYMHNLIYGDAKILLKIGVGMNILGFLAIQKLVRIKY